VSRARRAGGTKPATRTVTTVLLEREPARVKKRDRKDDALERVLEKVSSPSAPLVARAVAERVTVEPVVRAAPAVPVLRTARLASVSPQVIEIAFRGAARPVVAELGEGVQRELVAQAMKQRDAVLVEWTADSTPIVVGVVQTRIPTEVVIKGQKITIDAEEELTLRAGPSAMRLRQDGEVELVGSRIAIASRGLFRLVGRMLRLN
jgi:hypothetical protein